MDLRIENSETLATRMKEASRRFQDALNTEHRDLDHLAREYALAVKNYRLAVVASFDRN
jgi:hypothetical protein